MNENTIKIIKTIYAELPTWGAEAAKIEQPVDVEAFVDAYFNASDAQEAELETVRACIALGFGFNW